MSVEKPTQAVDREALRAVIEADELPSSSQVLESFDSKRAALQQRISELDATYGGILNANELMARDREKRKAHADLDQVNSLWSELGGEDIDAATQLKNELDFKADGNDHAVANSNIADARIKFYDNFTKEYVDDSEARGRDQEASASVPSELSDEATPAVSETPISNTPESTAPAEAEPVSVATETPTQEGSNAERSTPAVTAENAPADPELSDVIVNPNAPPTPEQIAQIDSIAGRHPISDAFNAAQAAARERRLAEQQTSLSGIEVAFRQNPENQPVIEGLRNAQDRYSQLKEQSETWGRWGRRKREIELTEAEQTLKQAEITYARSVTEAKVSAGLLEAETPEELRSIRGEQLFGTLRQLANERRQMVKALRTEKIENPQLHMRALGAIGKFFNGGGKWSRRLKAGGLGAGAGVATALSGLGWPVTLAASTGVGLLIRGGSVVDNLNKQVAGIGVEGTDSAIMTDAQLSAFMDNFRNNSSVPWEGAADQFSQVTLDAARIQGHENADAARAEANKNFRRYTVGFGLGAGATLLASGVLNTVHAASAPSSPQIAPLQPESPYHPLPSPHEFHAGGDRITSGEGWFSQFRDMGMTDTEAHALFSDDKIMKQLVDSGAAYADDSARIGGFGINMPKGGHLSAKAMEIIGKAMTAKGY